MLIPISFDPKYVLRSYARTDFIFRMGEDRKYVRDIYPSCGISLSLIFCDVKLSLFVLLHLSDILTDLS